MAQICKQITLTTEDKVGLLADVTGAIRDAGVNIRSEPDVSSLLVSGASTGANVVGTGATEGAWLEVTYDGVTGWASGNYLEPVGASEQVLSGDD